MVVAGTEEKLSEEVEEFTVVTSLVELLESASVDCVTKTVVCVSTAVVSSPETSPPHPVGIEADNCAVVVVLSEVTELVMVVAEVVVVFVEASAFVETVVFTEVASSFALGFFAEVVTFDEVSAFNEAVLFAKVVPDVE